MIGREMYCFLSSFRISLRNLILSVTLIVLLLVPILRIYQVEVAFRHFETRGYDLARNESLTSPSWIHQFIDLFSRRRAYQIVGLVLPGSREISHVDLSYLSEFPNMENLELALVEDELLSRMPRMENLRSLHLNSDGNLTKSGLDALSNCPNLVKLSLMVESSDEDLLPVCKLLQLRELTIEAQISGQFLKSLGRLKKLEYLCVYGTPDLDDGLLHLPVLPSLKLLELNYLPGKGHGLAAITHLPNLEELCLQSCFELQTASLGALSGNPHLKSIFITGPDVDDSSIGVFQSMPKLRELYIANSDKKDAATWLKSLSHLESLSVDRVVLKPSGDKLTTSPVQERTMSKPDLDK